MRRKDDCRKQGSQRKAGTRWEHRSAPYNSRGKTETPQISFTQTKAVTIALVFSSVPSLLKSLGWYKDVSRLVLLEKVRKSKLFNVQETD